MSSNKQRKETNCLNCNAELHGRYCHICGQENSEPNESFWNLTSHFVADLFHYDGKFLRTLKYLVFKPGYLAKEHIRGKRIDYLHPIRLYVFVSAVFFLIMYTFFSSHSHLQPKKLTDEEIKEMKATPYEKALKHFENVKKYNLKRFVEDSLKKGNKTDTNGKYYQTYNSLTSNYKEENNMIDRAIALIKKDSTLIDSAYAITPIERKFENVNEYLAYQKRLPPKKQDIYLKKKIEIYTTQKREIELLTGTSVQNLAIEDALHLIPKALFLTVPIIAFLFYVFYIRNKKLNYVAHLLFTIYLFCFLFLNFLFFRIVYAFLHYLKPDKQFGIIIFLCSIISLVYLYKSFRNFYNQSRLKTLLKIFLMFFPMFFVLIFICVFIFLSLAVSA